MSSWGASSSGAAALDPIPCSRRKRVRGSEGWSMEFHRGSHGIYSLIGRKGEGERPLLSGYNRLNSFLPEATTVGPPDGPPTTIQVAPDAGHSANEAGIAADLAATNEKFKNILKIDGFKLVVVCGLKRIKLKEIAGEADPSICLYLVSHTLKNRWMSGYWMLVRGSR
ncbi:uncharacterized protein LOC108510690 [Phoenix dactylifera]|uniref:Uncharacterized protein LOC108510690 n=1 Tax=Phoenix dactylifera TaxID=42345 RepID=A0A8B8J4A6_PHODC|nr:uncharacterized protein LOC108510690 [Phoenix dactylifera]